MVRVALDREVQAMGEDSHCLGFFVVIPSYHQKQEWENPRRIQPKLQLNTVELEARLVKEALLGVGLEEFLEGESHLG